MPTVPNDGSLSFEDALAQSNNQPQEPDTGGGALTFEQAKQQAGVALSTQLRATTRINAERDPMAVAEAERLAGQFGVPADVAERNLDALRQQEVMAGADRLAAESPRLSEWMVEDPNAAAIVRDSTQQLSTIEKIFQGYFNTVYRAPASGAVSGIGGAVSGLGEAASIPGRAVSRVGQSVLRFFSEDLADQYAENEQRALETIPWWMFSDQLLQAAGGKIKEFGQDIAVPEDQQNTLTDIGQGVGSFLPTAAAFALNPVVGLLATGSQGVDLQADRAKEAGTYGTTSADIGMALGAPVTAITERMGYGWLMKALPEPARRAFLTRVGDIVKSGLGEGAQEVTESMLQDAITRAAVDENFDMFQGLDREGIAAFGVGALIRGTMHLGRMTQDSQQAGIEQREIEQIAKEVDATGLREASPGRLQEAIGRLKANGRDSVYVPASEFQQLFQEEKADEVRRAAGVDDAEYVQALTTGGRIRISAEGFFAGMDPADRNALVPHARWTYEGMTPVEAEKFDPEQAVAEFYGELGRSVDPSNRAFDYVRMALENAGATPDVAEAQAEMLAAKIRTLSYRSGMSVDRLLGEAGNERLNVRRAVSAEVQRILDRQNKDAEVDSLIDAYRSGRLFSDKEIKGQRLVSAIIKAGGIQPDAFGAGDLKSQDLGKVRPGFFSNKGMTLDEALTLARQEGYIEPSPEDRPDDIGINDLNELIIEDARGNGVFRLYDWNTNRLEFNNAVETLGEELRALGISDERLREMSNADVRRALAGVVTGEGGQVLDQAVWHGSPHRGIEQTGFSLQKIGTGEGAQAYGWGLYFAGKKEIAEWYREQLSRRNEVDLWTDELRSQLPEPLTPAELNERGALGRKMLSGLSPQEMARWRELKDREDAYNEAVERLRPQGQLYAAEIPDDGDLLDWDAPLSEQPEKVQQALAAMDPDNYSPDGDEYDANETGQMIYLRLAAKFAKPAKNDDRGAPKGWGSAGTDTDERAWSGERAASEALLAAGIPGLRYLDGTSRGAGDGSRNYVIWDEGAISDVKTFYQTTPQQAMETNVPVEMPADPLFAEAVANTQGASITSDGLLIDLVRFQKPEQEGAQAIRTGVFYLPTGAATAKHYRNKGTAASGNQYGGTEKFQGETLIRRPLFVKGATGGKAPESAYDALKGKGAYQKMRADVLHFMGTSYLSQEDRINSIQEGLKRHGADPSLAAEILRFSKGGNLLPYALQENIVAHAVRDAGYDAAVGYSKGKAGASISEVFDVREQTFPARGVDSQIHEKFYQSQPGQDGTPAEAFRGITREQFLGKPKILPASNSAQLEPKALTTVKDAEPEPFLDKYQARYSEDGVAVYDGDKVVASYNFGDTLVVDKKYRRQGIAEEMVYQWRARNPSAKPATSRTKASQALQEKVWERIQRELRAGEQRLFQSQQQRTPESLEVYDDEGEFKTVDDLVAGLNDGRLLIHVRVKDGTELKYGIDPSAGEYLRSTEAWQEAADQFGEGPELTFFADSLQWADSNHLADIRGGGELQAVFVRKTDSIQKSLGNGRVQTADGREMSYEMSPLADYESDLFKGEPAGVERGDWYTNKTQDVVAVVDVADLMARQQPAVTTLDVTNSGGESSQFTLKSADGATLVSGTVREDDNTVTVRWIEASAGERGKGYGSEAYAKLAEYALSRGKELTSDSSVSDSAARSWASLRKAGYVVKTAEDVRTVDGAIETPDDSPVFRLTGRNDRPTSDPSILKQEARGSLTIGPAGYPGGMRQFLITLGQGADKSTFLHESAHFHLELLREVDAELRVRDPESLSKDQKRLLADHDALLKWLGVDSFDAIERAHHEKYAETWEAYSLEGRAPSVRLQRVLYKFSTWLKLIYKTLKGLPNANLTDEVREIFDRMLATDDEIDAARQAQQFTTLFNDPAEYGMNDEEWRQLREADRVSRQSAIEAEQGEQYRYALAEQKRWRSAEMAKLREEAAGIIQSSPMYRAAYLLRKGTLPNGDPLPEGQRPVKLNRQEMIDRYGKDFVGKELRGMVADDGKPADMVAQVLGYADGRELVDAVIKVLPREDAIKVEADRLWHERNPNPMLDGSLEARVQKAIHNDAWASVRVRELNALQKRVGKPGQPVVLQVMKNAAERIVGATRVRDLNANRHKATEVREGKEAMRAAAEGRLEDAIAALKRHLMAGLLYRETLKAQERAESHRAHAVKLTKKSAQERFAKAGWENYLDKINQILEAYEFRRVSNRELDRRTSLRDWVNSQQDEGEVTAVSEELLARVERNKIKNYRDATVSELDAVNDALRNIEHLARLKNKLLAGAREADKAEAVAELVARAEQSLPEIRDEDTPEKRRPIGERVIRAGGQALANLNRPENVIEALDGGQSGPWHDFIWTALEKAEGKMQALRVEMMGRLRTLRESMPSGFMQSLNEPVTVFGIKMTRSELVALVLNTGNEGNLQRLMDGGIGDKTGAKKLNRNQVNEMVAMLTADELKFVQSMWDTVGSLWPEIEALTRRVGGVRPDRVEGRDFVTQSIDGKTVAMRGAYWPLVYDPKRTKQGENQQEANAKQALMAEGFIRAATSKGHTKGRAEKVDATLKRDFAQIMSVHLDQVMTDIAYREAVRDVDSLLRTPAVKSAIIFRLGQDAYDNLQGALSYSVSASNGIAGRVATGWRWLDTVFANMSVSALAIRPDIALGNLSSAMIQGLDRVGVRALMRGLHSVMTSWQRTSDAIAAKSPFMQNRINDTDFFYQQEMTKIGGERGYGPAYRRYMMTLHRTADAVVSRSLWWGHYQANLDKGEAEAIRLADKAIRQTQTASGRKDISTFERDPSFKQTRQFMGPMFVIFGRMYAAARGEGATRSIGARAATAAIQWFLAPAIFMLAAGRWAEDGDDDDEDVGPNEWALWLATTVGLFPVQTLPVLRDIGSLAESILTDKPVSPRAPPTTQAVAGMGRAGLSIANNIEAYRDGDDIDWWDMTRDLTTIGAPLFGAPASQVRITTKTIQYWTDDPEEGRAELAAMAVYGPPKDYRPQ